MKESQGVQEEEFVSVLEKTFHKLYHSEALKHDLLKVWFQPTLTSMPHPGNPSSPLCFSLGTAHSTISFSKCSACLLMSCLKNSTGKHIPDPNSDNKVAQLQLSQKIILKQSGGIKASYFHLYLKGESLSKQNIFHTNSYCGTHYIQMLCKFNPFTLSSPIY